ncbi:hypothetical protein B0O95_1612, partial [Mycetohabitans endofungorum]
MVSLPDNDSAARELNDVLQWFDADRGEFVWLEQLIAQHPVAFFASNRFKPGGAHSDAETTFSMIDLPETAALPDAHAAHLLDDVFSRVMPVASPTFVGHMTSSLPSFLPSLAKVLTALRVANATWTSGRKARILRSWQDAKSAMNCGR